MLSFGVRRGIAAVDVLFPAHCGPKKCERGDLSPHAKSPAFLARPRAEADLVPVAAVRDPRAVLAVVAAGSLVPRREAGPYRWVPGVCLRRAVTALTPHAE